MEYNKLTPKQLSLLTEADFKQWISNIISKVKNKIGRGSIKKGDILVYDYTAATFPDKIAFYDAFPLILVTSVDAQHFTGTNLNYIPIRERKRLVKYLKQLYPKEFKDTENKQPLPGFNFEKVKVEFPYIADVCVHRYLKSQASKISILPPAELDALSYVDTSNFIFKADSPIKSAEQLWKIWRNGKELQSKNNIRK